MLLFCFIVSKAMRKVMINQGRVNTHYYIIYLFSAFLVDKSVYFTKSKL